MMPFSPGDIFSFDVGWEQFFWDAAEALSPERNGISSNGIASTVVNDHGSVREAMQLRSSSSKGKHRRNRKDKEWHAIDRIVKARKAVRKESNVYLDKQLIDPRKLQKNTSRPRCLQPFDKYAPVPPVPQDFEIRTPESHDDSPPWTQELPFMQFRSLFRQSEIPQTYPQGLFSQDSDSALHQTVAITHFQIIIPKLEALLPAPMLCAYTAGSSEERLKVELAGRTYFDLLSFSVANNFTGLDGLSPHRVLEYLKSQTITHIARLMQSIGGHTGRALAEKLFLCAIEAKDSSIAEMILRYGRNTKVDANKSVCICKYNGLRYTPIERSAELRDIETTKVLLKYGADVNKAIVEMRDSRFDRGGWRGGALSCALHMRMKENTTVEFELFQLLLAHSAYVGTRELQAALGQQRSEVLHALFQAGARENHEEWGESGFFGQVIQVLDEEAATASINMLKKIGANINAPQDRKRPTMLDMAAKRGSFDLVLMLLYYGAIQTETTLSYAIQNHNRAVVNLFLNGDNVDDLSCDNPPTTPYAEAVRIGDETLMEILEQKGSWSNITEQRRYIAALDAASEVGNAEVVRRLLDVSPEMRKSYRLQQAFNNALITALGVNNEIIAIMLLYTGNINLREHFSTPPMQKALENRNIEIVRALLDFATGPSTVSGPILLLATKWGDISILEDLLVSGCDIEDGFGAAALIIAIEKHDRQLIHFLLNAGSDFNASCFDEKGQLSTPLSTAIKIQDIDMVNYLLSVGADPGDPAALLRSCEKGGDALGLLLDAFLKRYPNGKRGYYDDALVHAVQKNDMSMLKSLRPVIALKFPGYSQYAGKLIGARLIASNEVGLRAVQVLLDAGANPDAVVWSEGTERISLLSAAIKAENVQMIQLLLDKGSKVNFPATRGVKFTPIQLAAKIGHYEIVLQLINRGADVDAAAAEVGGGTAIQLASIGGFVGIVDYLLKRGAKVDRSPSTVHGRTALEGAAEWGRLDMVQFLLQNGAQIDGQGRRSFLNAMKLAEENGHFVVLELLQSHSS